MKTLVPTTVSEEPKMSVSQWSPAVSKQREVPSPSRACPHTDNFALVSVMSLAEMEDSQIVKKNIILKSLEDYA